MPQSAVDRAASAASMRDINTDNTQSKIKLFDMLSAIDRKKRKALPQQSKNRFQAIQGLIQSHFNLQYMPLTTITAPSTDSLVLTQNLSSASYPCKLQPRGAAERKDFSDLRNFLTNNPSRPEDQQVVYEPRSSFDWEDGSHGESGGNKKVRTKVRALERVAKRQAAGSGNGRGERPRVTNPVETTGGLVDKWIEDTRGFMRGRRNEEEAGSLGGVGHVKEVGSGKDTIRRGSVLKLFNDPVWDNDADGKLNPLARLT